MNPWWFFGLTLVLEAPVIALFYRGQWKEAALPFLLLNLFTWPLLHYLLQTTDLPLPLMELGVALAEMTGYALLVRGGWGKAFLAAFAANGFSYGVGLIIIRVWF